MIELFSTPQAWISLATLAALEIVLGIDNLVFITILAGKLPGSKLNRSAPRRVNKRTSVSVQSSQMKLRHPINQPCFVPYLQ